MCTSVPRRLQTTTNSDNRTFTIQSNTLINNIIVIQISSKRQTSVMIELKKVLVADAVHENCIQLLKQHQIHVDCKYKLPLDKLIDEIKVII